MSVHCSNVPRILVVMGVSGAGKSTIGQLLAQRLGWPFEEGDALHPQSNVVKMAAGRPLTDDDRAPWLARIAAWVDQCLAAGGCGVVTCSALKRRYRDTIAHGRSGVLFLFLDGPPQRIGERLAARQGHFMPATLLDSQFATLERPGADEAALIVDATETPGAIVDALMQCLAVETRPGSGSP